MYPHATAKETKLCNGLERYHEKQQQQQQQQWRGQRLGATVPPSDKTDKKNIEPTTVKLF